jgi:hypothetical protein
MDDDYYGKLIHIQETIRATNGELGGIGKAMGYITFLLLFGDALLFGIFMKMFNYL